MIKKYLKKDLISRRKTKKLLIIWDECNSIIMEYQKIIKLLENSPIQLSGFRTKNWIEINDESWNISSFYNLQ